MNGLFAWSPSVRVFAARAAVDFRRGADSLRGLVRDGFGADPLSGHLFVFFNRARNRLKILVWDCNGFWLLSKRLERGTFERIAAPADAHATRIELSRLELSLVLEGIALASAKRRNQFVVELRPTGRDGDGRPQRIERAARAAG